MKRCTSVLLIILISGFTEINITRCHHPKSSELKVVVQQTVKYKTARGQKVVASYLTLSDNSLRFVKVRFADGKEYTLPQTLSASGVRYTDERELVWWTKGDSAFAENRDANGEWRIEFQFGIE